MPLLRRLTLLVLGLAISATALAGTSTDAVQRFGAPVTVKKSVDLAKLGRQPAKFAGRTLRIEGTVKEVCQGQGCWVEVEGAKGASFIARSLDESVLLPMNCVGQKVIVQGLLVAMPQKGHAHAADEKLAEHSCPTPNYVLSTQGVELVAKK